MFLLQSTKTWIMIVKIICQIKKVFIQGLDYSIQILEIDRPVCMAATSYSSPISVPTNAQILEEKAEGLVRLYTDCRTER